MKNLKITVNGVAYDVQVEETNGAAVPAAPEYANGRYRYVLRVEEGTLPGVSQRFQLRVYAREKLAERPGDRLSGEISFYLPPETGQSLR